MNDDPSVGPFLGPLIFLVLLASLWGWWRALDRLARGNALLDFEPRRESPWGLVDLMVTFLLLLACPAFASWLVANWYGIELPAELADLSPDARAAVLLGAAVATMAAFLLSVIAVRLRTGATLADFGFDRRQIAADLRLGATAFAMLAPIVYTIQMLLVRLVESKHPLIELLQEHPDPRFFVLSGLAAVVVAPVAEEYFFRVLLQGWLERRAVFRSEAVHVVLGGRPDEPKRPPPTQGQLDETNSAVPQNPYQPPRSVEPAVEVVAGGADDGRSLRQMWPILVSALLFSLAHYSHGPDPIPLFVLAVGLGYLYHRTHRVLPCIVVHFLLNICSLAVLWLVVYFDGQPGL